MLLTSESFRSVMILLHVTVDLFDLGLSGAPIACPRPKVHHRHMQQRHGFTSGLRFFLRILPEVD